MIRALLLPLIFGLGGAAILVSLCVWQVQRLAWKNDLVAEIEARASAEPAPLPASPDPERDRYLPVVASGEVQPAALHFLTSVQFEGPGFRVISPFVTEGGRRILLDRGFVPEPEKEAALFSGAAQVTGNLDWPRESDLFTPEPNTERNIWFARDVAAMAEALQTEPVMIVANRPTGTPSPRPIPVTVRLPNNHLQYAITWGLMAVVWLAMTALLVLRIRSRAH